MLGRLRGVAGNVAAGVVVLVLLLVFGPAVVLCSLFWDEDPADSYKYRNL